MSDNNKAQQSAMASYYTPETMAQCQAREAVVDDWRPGQPLHFRRKAKPQSQKDWRPMTYDMKRAIINAQARASS